MLAKPLTNCFKCSGQTPMKTKQHESVFKDGKSFCGFNLKRESVTRFFQCKRFFLLTWKRR